MELFHSTGTSSAISVQTHGLLTSKAQTVRHVVWLTTRSRMIWGRLHTAGRHRLSAAQVVTFRVSVPRSWLTRFRRGLWTCDRDIPATRLTVVRKR